MEAPPAEAEGGDGDGAAMKKSSAGEVDEGAATGAVAAEGEAAEGCEQALAMPKSSGGSAPAGAAVVERDGEEV